MKTFTHLGNNKLAQSAYWFATGMWVHQYKFYALQYLLLVYNWRIGVWGTAHDSLLVFALVFAVPGQDLRHV